MSEIIITIVAVAVFHSPLKDRPLYIDPGSGSFIIQLILATLLGAIFILKTYWKRIKNAISKIFHRDSENPEE
jgi:hypothetical protein